MKMTIEEYLKMMHTKESVKSYLYQIRNYLGLNPNAERFSYSDVLNYLATIKARYTNDVVRCTQLASIKKYYDYLLYIGKRDSHPCRTIYIKRDKRQVQHHKLFTARELDLLLSRENRYKVLKMRNKAMISLLIYQGLRSEEMTRLKLSDIYLEEGVINIKSTKTTSGRKLELKENQVSYLQMYISEYRDQLLNGRNSDCLFITNRGEGISIESIERMLRPLKSLFPTRSINASLIRQSVISNWLNQRGILLGDVQLMAGHKYPSSTEKYIKPDSDEQRKIINQFHPLE